MDRKTLDYAIILLLATMSSAVIFNNLGDSTIYSWDEARHAQNALEILKTGDWVVLNYGGKPDMWNLKPPLGAWLIAVSFKILGTNEFALRVWSALAGVGTITLLYLFGREMGNRYTGLFAAITLLTAKGFIGYHSARTGDYDAPLAFFITLAIFFFYLSRKRKNKAYIIPSAISTALGLMTKGVVGLAPIPVALAYLLYERSLKRTVLARETAYAAMAFTGITTPWLIARFLRGSDFFAYMINKDLLRRFSEPIEGHFGDSAYYLMALDTGLGRYWLILLIAAFAYSLYLILKRKNKELLLLSSWITLFMGVFTLAGTKISWYMVPVYPAISLLIAYHAGGYAKEISKGRIKIEGIATIVLLLILAAQSFLTVAAMVQNPSKDRQIESIKDFGEDLSRVNNLYFQASEEGRKRQSIIFLLSARIKGNVLQYEKLKSENLAKDDAVITFNADTAKAISTNPDYVLVKKNEYISLFKSRG